MQTKHWKRTGGILFLFLVLGLGIYQIKYNTIDSEVNSGFLGLVQEHISDYDIYTYMDFFEKNSQIKKSTSISIDGTLGESIFVIGTGSNSFIGGNIDIDSYSSKELSHTYHNIRIDLKGNPSELDSEVRPSIQADIDIYIDQIQNDTYIQINTRDLNYEETDPNIQLLNQFIKLQQGTWIRWNNTNGYSPGRRLTLIDKNMQRARIVPDLSMTDAWYITTSGTGATLDANIHATSQQIELEDKNNVFKLWLEKEDKEEYKLSILTAPDITGRLDGNWAIDVSNDDILESSKGNITFPLGIDIGYEYTSIIVSQKFQGIIPSMYIDGEKLLGTILK